MCGILGLMQQTSGSEDNSLELIQEMAGRLAHRGPDSDGFLRQGPISLAVRRLRIIDLKTGDQPIRNEDATIWAINNGEIYNYRELRSRLEKKGHIFTTDSDTEVLVHLYEEEGIEFTEFLRGMYACAIWDSGREQLILARDPFGIKPLFIARSGSHLAFASEIKALYPLKWVDWGWDPVALRAYLQLSYVPKPLTAFRGVRKFEQGSVQVFAYNSTGALEQKQFKKFWQPKVKVRQPIPSFEKATDDVFSMLTESVRMQLQSDVPVGAFLSGGIDSSAIAALMCQLGFGNLKTFSIGFEDAAYNELPYAKLMARHLQVEHYSQIVTATDAAQMVELVERFDEPFGDSSAIPTYFVSRLARQYVTVVLTGEGGDELFAGYKHYDRMSDSNRAYLFIPYSIRIMLARYVLPRFPLNSRGRKTVEEMSRPAKERYVWLIYHALEPFKGFFSKRFWDFIGHSDLDDSWKEAYYTFGQIPGAMETDQRTVLADDFLAKVDRSSMAVSLECRVPFLDHVFADYVNALPAEYKRKGHESKYILKQAFKPYLPDEIIRKPKQGFAIPVHKWLNGPLKSRVKEYLAGTSGDIFSAEGEKQIMQLVENEDQESGRFVWYCLCLAIWAGQHPN